MDAREQTGQASQSLLLKAIPLFALMHLAAILLFPGHYLLFNLIVGIAPLVPVACIVWRTRYLEPWLRSAWYWIIFGLLLWSAAEMCELHVTHLANNATPTFSDYLFLLSGVPLLLGVSSTPATRSIPYLTLLNVLQSLLGAGLLYVRLFDMPVTAGTGGVGALYNSVNMLVLLVVTLRYLAATVTEDKRTLGLLSVYLAIYLPFEGVTDYVARLWNLPIGTPLELVYSLPFLLLAWYALKMPTGNGSYEQEDRAGRRWKLFLQSLCPMLFTGSVFALGVSVAQQHVTLASVAMTLCLVLQGLHAGAIQTRYVLDHKRLQRQEQLLLEANGTLEQLSLIDELTGISNRRHLMEGLRRECERASRREEWLSLLMIDADYFKGVNDLHGHAYGDECLSTLARLLQTVNRGMDLAARYGGEEFIVMLPNTDASGADVVAERLHTVLRECNLPNDASPERRLTVSIGVATARVKRGMTASAWIEAADGALYEAKQTGRNQSRAVEVQAVESQLNSALREQASEHAH